MNETLKQLKRWLKRKVRIDNRLLILFLITGGFSNILNAAPIENTATATDAIGIGVSSNASGAEAVSIGKSSIAVAHAIGIGVSSNANGDSAVSIGKNSSAITDAIGIGVSSNARGDRAVSIGKTSTAVADAIGIGVSSNAQGRGAVSIGESSNASGDRAVSIGKTSTAVADGIGIGVSSNASGERAVSIGKSSRATTDAVGIGVNSNASGAGAVSIGKSSVAVKDSVGIGLSSNASGDRAVSIGVRSTAVEDGIGIGAISNASRRAVSIGRDSTADSEAVAIGRISTATKFGAVAIGSNSKSTNDTAISVGYYSDARGQRSLALGSFAKATGATQSIAIGGGGRDGEGAQSIGSQSIAIGGNTIANGHSSIVIGGDDVEDGRKQTVDNYNDKNGNNVGTKNIDYIFSDLTGFSLLEGGMYRNGKAEHLAIAIGPKAIAGNLAMALGTNSNASGLASVAIGAGAISTLNNATVIGAGAVAKDQDGYRGTKQISTSVLPEGEKDPTKAVEFRWAGGENTLAGDIVSFGSKGYERQLKHVAPGEVSATSTDAVNGSQLHVVAAKVVTLLNEKATKGDIEALENKVNDQKIKYFSVKSTGGTNEDNKGATGENAIAIGKDSSAAGVGSISLGFEANAGNQNNTIAIGTSAAITGDGQSGIAIGGSSKVTANRGIALGDSTEAGWYSVALGSGNGTGAKATATHTVALGTGTKATHAYSVALGAGSETVAVSGAGYDPFGSTNNTATTWVTNKSVSVGKGTDITRRITSVAAGSADTDAVNVAQLKNVTMRVVGDETRPANGKDAEKLKLSVGKMKFTGSNGISTTATTAGDDVNVTIGLDTDTKAKVNSIGTGDVADGDNNTVTGDKVFDAIAETAFNVSNTENATNGTAVKAKGGSVNIVGNDDITSTVEAIANNAGANVKLAINKATNVAENEEKVVTSKAVYTAVSNARTTITNNGDTLLKVEGGAQTGIDGKAYTISIDKDALKNEVDNNFISNDEFTNDAVTGKVNKGKLEVDGADLSLTGDGTDKLIGGNLKISLSDKIKETINSKASEADLNTLKDNKLTIQGNSGSFERKNSDTKTLGIKAADFVFGTGTGAATNYKERNIKTQIDGDTLKIGISDTPTFDSVSLDSGISLTSNGIAMADKKISGLANGTDDKDAVNKKQLADTLAKLGGNASIDNQGNITAPTYTLNNATTINAGNQGATYNTVGDALTALDTAIGNQKISYTAKTGKKESVKLTEGLDFNAGTNLDVSVEPDNGKVKYTLAKNLNEIDSISKGNGKSTLTLNDDNILSNKDIYVGDTTDKGNKLVKASELTTIGDAIFTFKDDKANTPNTFARKNSENKSLTIKAGDISEGAQTSHLGKNLKVELSSTTNEGTYTIGLKDKVEFGEVKIVDGQNEGPVINATGIDLKEKALTNLKEGEIKADSKEAITGKQLKDLADKLGVEVETNGNNKDKAFTAPTFTKLKDATGTDAAKVPTTLKEAIEANIAALNRGIKYGADVYGTDSGTPNDKKTQYLGSTVDIKAGNVENGFVGTNLKTKYTYTNGDGKFEIGLTETPEFKAISIKNGNHEVARLDGSDAEGGKLTLKGENGKDAITVDGKNASITGANKIGKDDSNNIKFEDGQAGEKKAIVSVGGKELVFTSVAEEFSMPDGKKDFKDVVKISNVATPTDDYDAVNKKYVDEKLAATTASQPFEYYKGTDKVVRGQDGKLYKEADLENFKYDPKANNGQGGYVPKDPNAQPVPTLTDVPVNEVVIKAMPNKAPMSIGNVASALGQDGTDITSKYKDNKEAAIEKAKDLISGTDGLINKTDNLDNAVTLKDLQALAIAGLDFGANAGADIHRTLGTKVSIVGNANIVTEAAKKAKVEMGLAEDAAIEAARAKEYATKLKEEIAKTHTNKNVVTVTNPDTNEIEINLSKRPEFTGIDIKSEDPTKAGETIAINPDGMTVSKGDNKSTLTAENLTFGPKDPNAQDADKTSTVIGKDGMTVNGKDGKSDIEIKAGTDNAPAKIALKGADGKSDSVAIKGADGTSGPSIDFAKETAPNNEKLGTGKITGLANLDDNSDGTSAANKNYVDSKLAELNANRPFEYTTEGDKKVVRGQDGKLYKEDDIREKVYVDGVGYVEKGKTELVDGKHTLKENEKANKNTLKTESENLRISNDKVVLDAQPKGDGPVSIGNVAAALGNDTTAKYGKADGKEAAIAEAKKLVAGTNGTGGLINNITDAELNKVVTLKDLQAVAIAGIDFTGNTGAGTDIHRNLGEKVTIKGEGTDDKADFTSASGNIQVASDKDSATLTVKLSDKLKNMTSFETKDIDDKPDGVNSKTTVDKDGVKIKDKDGNVNKTTSTDIVLGKDGKDGAVTSAVTITSGSPEDAATGKPATGPSIDFAKDGENGTGKITGLAEVTENDKRDVAANKGYVDDRIQQLGNAIQNNTNAIQELKESTTKGIAGAMAQAGVKFQEIGINQASVGAAISSYKGTQGVAVGVQGAPTENVRVHGIISATPGKAGGANTGVTVGASWRFNLK